MGRDKLNGVESGVKTIFCPMSISKVRREYDRSGLRRDQLEGNPLTLYDRWVAEALEAGAHEPTAAALATVDPERRPSIRTVLLKGIDTGGIVFFTNYRSRKGRELAASPHGALLSYWPELERQIEAAGDVSRIPDAESDAYFATRPRGAQLGAWASDQSSVIQSRELLDRRLQEVDAEYEGREVPRPPYWGGYRLIPTTVQVWQGRPNRLHDRFRYRRSPEGWVIERLAP
jgi:pyridoxamine 5'-phosphate oxidase